MSHKMNIFMMFWKSNMAVSGTKKKTYKQPGYRAIQLENETDFQSWNCTISQVDVVIFRTDFWFLKIKEMQCAIS